MQKGEYYFAKTIPDLLQQINAIPNARIMGGCTLDAYIPQEQDAASPPSDNEKNIFISIRGIKELAHIVKHERYVDCGPGVTLSSLLAHSGGHIPSALIDAIQSIANPFVRNLATIGGNVMGTGHGRRRYMTLYAPLLALDAKLELKSKSDTRSVPLAALDGVPKEYILSNIRIPLDDWDVAIFRRLPAAGTDAQGATFTFLAATEKRLISNVRLSFAGNAAFRSLEVENKAIGIRLPLSPKDVDALVDAATDLFTDAVGGKENAITISMFRYLARYSFEQLG